MHLPTEEPQEMADRIRGHGRKIARCTEAQELRFNVNPCRALAVYHESSSWQNCDQPMPDSEVLLSGPKTWIWYTFANAIRGDVNEASSPSSIVHNRSDLR